MKNKLIDLNNHLFAQLERLSEEKTKGEKLKEEISRAKAVSGIASQIIANANLSLRAEEFKANHGGDKQTMPAMIESKGV